MNRTEELTLAWLDGTAGPDDEDELHDLITQSDSNARQHDSLVRIEVALFSARQLPPLAPQVLAQIEARRGRRISEAVLSRIAPSAKPPVRRTSRATVATVGVAVAFAACAWAAAVSLSSRQARRAADVRRADGDAPPAHVSLPVNPSDVPRPSPAPRRDAETSRAVHAAPPPVFFEGFESDASASLLAHGMVVARPSAAPGDSFAGQGTVSEYRGATLITLKFPPRDERIEWSDDATLSFDCWLGPGSDLGVLVWIPVRGQNYRLTLAGLPTQTWQRHTVRMGDLLPVSHSDRPAQAHDAIANLTFSTRLGSVLFIDNVAIAATGVR